MYICLSNKNNKRKAKRKKCLKKFKLKQEKATKLKSKKYIKILPSVVVLIKILNI